MSNDILFFIVLTVLIFFAPTFISVYKKGPWREVIRHNLWAGCLPFYWFILVFVVFMEDY